MDVPDPTYIESDEVVDQTLLTALQHLDPAEIDKLIQIAEEQIDAYVGPQPHHWADTNIERVFPREQDFSRVGSTGGVIEYPNTPEVPAKVSRACLRQVEWLYTQWYTTSGTSLLPTNQEVEQESIGGDGSYSATYARGGSLEGKVSLCTQAQELLKGFVSRVCGIGVTDPDTAPPVT